MKKEIFFVIILVFVISMVNASNIILRPNIQGYYSAWTNSGCSSGSVEWQCVDENPANISDYLKTSSKNLSESFGFSDSGLSDVVINSVTLYYYAKRVSTTRYKFLPLIRSESTDYLGSVISLSSNYQLISRTYTINPATGISWTINEVNNLEAGMMSYSSNYGGIIAQMYAVVNYNYPNSCSDSDGGNILNILGMTNGYFSGNLYNYSDICIDNNTIKEYYCNGVNLVNNSESCGSDSYVGSNFCMSGDVYRNYTDYYCSSGACGSSSSPVLQDDCIEGQYCSFGQCYWSDSCNDSDGGFMFYLNGASSGYFSQNNYSNGDFCLDSRYLLEYYCAGNYAYNYTFDCTGNTTGLCYNGACI